MSEENLSAQDERIRRIISNIPQELDGFTMLGEVYGFLSDYSVDGALHNEVSEALKRIRDYSEQKLASFSEVKELLPEGAVDWEIYLRVSNENPDKTNEQDTRNKEIAKVVAPLARRFDDEEEIIIDENTDLETNAASWDKIAEEVKIYEESVSEDGRKTRRVAPEFTHLGGFLASLDEQSLEEIIEAARLETLQDLSTQAPSSQEEAKEKYIAKFGSVLEETGVQLWNEYQKQSWMSSHPEFVPGSVTAEDLAREEKLNTAQEYITPYSEEEIQALDRRIEKNRTAKDKDKEPLSLSEMARLCKSRPLLNKNARAEMAEVIARASSSSKIEVDDLISLQYLLNEVERVPEYKKLNSEKNIAKANAHIESFRKKNKPQKDFVAHMQTLNVSFDRNTFADKKVLKSSVASVICARGVKAMQKAKRWAFLNKGKEIFNRVKAWDDKVTKRHPRLWPLTKTAVVSITTGIPGMVAYSSIKLGVAVHRSQVGFKQKAEEAKAQGQSYYKNWWSYIRAKENRKEAWDLGTTATLTAVSAAFGGAAVVNQGLAATGGLAGNIVNNGFSGMFSNAASSLSNLSWENVSHAVVSRVTDPQWYINAGKKAVKAVTTNSRVLAATALSINQGIQTSRLTAQQQREAEKQLDEMLKSIGVQNLPQDRKTLKLRSKNPAMYVDTVLQSNNITLSDEKKEAFSKQSEQITALREEKIKRFQGAFLCSGLGLVMAGAMGASHGDTPAQHSDANTPTDEGIAAASKGSALGQSMELADNEEITVGDKLRQMWESDNDSSYNAPWQHQDTPEAQNIETASPEAVAAEAAANDGIDVHNLSDEQKHDLDMLFKRYPRAASLILEGNANPSVDDSPAHGVLGSAKLQSMYEGGQITDEQLKNMVKFAGNHFDEHGDFTGDDAARLQAEANSSAERASNPPSNDAELKANIAFSAPEIDFDDELTGLDKGSSLSGGNSGTGENLSGAAPANEPTLEEAFDGLTADNQQTAVTTKSGVIVEFNDKGGFTVIPETANDEMTAKELVREVNDALKSKLASGETLTAGQQAFMQEYAANHPEVAPENNVVTPDLSADNQQQTAAALDPDAKPAMGFRFDEKSGTITTFSGVSFTLEEDGSPIYSQVYSAEQVAQAEAEFFSVLKTEYSVTGEVKPSYMAFMTDYAKDHNIELTVAAPNNTPNNDLAAAATVSAKPDLTASQNPNGAAVAAAEPPAAPKVQPTARTADDDLYYTPKKGVAAANQGEAAATYEDAAGAGYHEGEVASQRRIWQYNGVKGHYSMIYHENRPPELDVRYLNNVPERLDIRGHINATMMWNQDGSYREYLGGFIHGNDNQTGPQVDRFCRNVEGGDVVYRNLMQRLANGKTINDIEQQWMTSFEKDMKTIGLGYVDGRLQIVQNADDLRAKWYGTENSEVAAQRINARASQYQQRIRTQSTY